MRDQHRPRHAAATAAETASMANHSHRQKNTTCPARTSLVEPAGLAVEKHRVVRWNKRRRAMVMSRMAVSLAGGNSPGIAPLISPFLFSFSPLSELLGFFDVIIPRITIAH